MLSRIVTVCVVGTAALASAVSAAAGTLPTPGAVGGGSSGEATYINPPSPICSTAQSTASNVKTDCESIGPFNETSVAVDPKNPSHIVGSANDYQLFLTPGGQVVETVLSRARVTFDGGLSWTTYPIDYSGYLFTGDPSVAFDAAGNVYLATLAVGYNNNPDVVVAHSSDGGTTWSKPVRVAAGSGSFLRTGTLNDHPILTAWGNGNALVTWIPYVFGSRGTLASVPVADAVSHDGGATWSSANIISGAAPFCVGLITTNACDQTWGNAVARSPSGRIVVSFYNTSQYAPDGSTNLGRNTYMAVVVDQQTGARTGGPYRIGLAFDGINEHDFPVSIDQRQTLHDSEFRLVVYGSIAADPSDPTGKHFAIAWYDDRNAPHPVASDPYTAVTDSDIIVSQSFDGGVTWRAPTALRAPGDQFMPWTAYDSTGRLRVGYFDRSYDSANHKYGYTLATETQPGSLTFATIQATTALSDPTRDDRWFSAVTVNPDFPHPTRFLGDYSAVAVTPTSAVAYWTDMREPACFSVRCGFGENTFVAALP